MKAATAKRLARLEAKHSPPVVCCVMIGADGPATRADGTVCTVHHHRLVTIGGSNATHNG